MQDPSKVDTKVTDCGIKECNLFNYSAVKCTPCDSQGQPSHCFIPPPPNEPQTSACCFWDPKGNDGAGSITMGDGQYSWDDIRSWVFWMVGIFLVCWCTPCVLLTRRCCCPNCCGCLCFWRRRRKKQTTVLPVDAATVSSSSLPPPEG
eukprot:TRINITY_DN262_c0_g1_i1.p1 TRINITY_DN262_c0_g1~~TRINITY_DN262_c0_g1_i1.p1  ORF type:complete len:173 (+),score=11.62 TRINITY_DN262_c0_g1_i1:76-519(+)